MKTLSFDEILPFIQVDSPLFLSRKMITGVSTDTRSLKKGDLFFALSGKKVDGHAFLKEAATLGASAAVVEKKIEGLQLEQIIVPNVLKALQNLAKGLLKKYPPKKVIGVTGSAGKTTCKDFIHTLLKEKYLVASSFGNQNSAVGLPLSILNQGLMGEEVLVLEMGMTDRGHIEELVNFAPPDIAIITSVFLCHMDHLRDLSSIREAKSEILKHPKTEWGIINREIIDFDEVKMSGACQKISFAYPGKEADYSLSIEGEDLQLVSPGEVISLGPFRVLGEHNRLNLLPALIVSKLLGLSVEEIRRGVEKLKLPKLRLELIQKEDKTFLNDAYNANPQSMLEAIKVLSAFPKQGKKVAVLGGMKELGSYSEACHLQVFQEALKVVDELFCIGEEFYSLAKLQEKSIKPIFWALEKEEVVPHLKRALEPLSITLVKGSNSYKLWTLLDEF